MQCTQISINNLIFKLLLANLFATGQQQIHIRSIEWLFSYSTESFFLINIYFRLIYLSVGVQ